ncbi:hypothetical protein HanRHA438_Chr17g0814821 [Helianthus annuus]|nr:hypothetical protein HanIR_Chr17g0872961 [Helianthus annuus]KAJ0447679.1 hypothetical protein HanHA89_Chr17g0708051 [Helianthus annuus]KAJ0632580.1 hypothetical protein HanLR1_Chr17g0666681 [Helianthus annuus]KAJ0667838.1 hypothetical protein HanPI659440_Chr17g0682191 [Helianthus annuus]KAJ0813332.1 hypothetical protein HanPSC8_Chr17g0772181 [Helianthus annuus]
MNTNFFTTPPTPTAHHCHDSDRGETYDFFTHGIQDQRWWHLVELLVWRYTTIRGKSDPIYSLMTSGGIKWSTTRYGGGFTG